MDVLRERLGPRRGSGQVRAPAGRSCHLALRRMGRPGPHRQAVGDVRGHRRGRRRGRPDVGLRGDVRPGRGRHGRRPLRGIVRAGGPRPYHRPNPRLVPKRYHLALRSRSHARLGRDIGRVLAALRERRLVEGWRSGLHAEGGRCCHLVLRCGQDAARPGGRLLRDRRPRRERQRAAVGFPRNLYDGGRRHGGRPHGAGVRGHRAEGYDRQVLWLVPKRHNLSFR